MPVLELSLVSGEDSLSVRRFAVQEKMSSLFAVTVIATSPNEDIDTEAIVGHPAGLRINASAVPNPEDERFWTGVCTHMELTQIEPTGLSTYELGIAPALWLLTHRRRHRAFHHQSIPEIVEKILREWHIGHAFRIDRKRYPKLHQRTQYGESDYAFLSRLLEEAGISFFFRQHGQDETHLILHDRPHHEDVREGKPIPFVDNPNDAPDQTHVTRVRFTHNVRPGRLTIRDHDFRRSHAYQLVAETPKTNTIEDLLEHHDYAPGSFLVVSEKDGDPAAPKGDAHHDEKLGKAMAERGLEALRASKRVVSYATNALDLQPGVVFSIGSFPHRALAPDKRLLVTEASIEGGVHGKWQMEGRAAFTQYAYRPPRVTPKPHIQGVQSAIVVGPKGEDIHTDEFGRVQVEFHWSRDGSPDPNSAFWVRVSQASAGAGAGVVTLPRVGQEVLIGFLEGDPDQPIVVGRLFNATSRAPYKLPDQKTVSAWRTASTGGSTGFNELRFDDASGNELVHMHAERHLTKVVKVDETETTGSHRLIQVGKKLTLTTGQASIILDGPTITLEARKEIRIRSSKGNIILQGGRRVITNPSPASLKKKKKPSSTGEEATPILSSGGTDYAAHAAGSGPETVRYQRGLYIKGNRQFRADARAAIERLKKTRTGRSLLKKLRRTGRRVTITQTSDQNGYCKAKRLNDALRKPWGTPGKGSGSNVQFNPKFKPKVPSEVVLGHELVHALHNATGTHESGVGAIPPNRGVDKEELSTTGLPPFTAKVPTENSLRRDMDLPKRKKY